MRGQWSFSFGSFLFEGTQLVLRADGEDCSRGGGPGFRAHGLTWTRANTRSLDFARDYRVGLKL